MAIYKRGKTWWGRYRGKRYSLGVPISPDAKIQRKLAEEANTKKRHEIDEDIIFPGRHEQKTRTLKDGIERFMKEHGNTLAAAKCYYHVNEDGKVFGYAARLYDFFGVNTRLAEITSAKVQDYKMKRAADGLTATGINRELDLLQGVFQRAITIWKWARINPVIEAGQVAGEKERTRYLSGEEEARILLACPPWLQTVVRFVLQTGLRRQEVISLTWSNVDLARGVLTVSKATSKTKKARALPLNAEAIAILGALVPSKQVLHVFYRVLDGETPSESHRPYLKDHVTHAFAKAVERAGLEGLDPVSGDVGVHFHDLRHTFASRLAQGGVDLYPIQIFMGHSNAAMTQRYAHLNVKSLREAVAGTKHGTPMPAELTQASGSC